MKTNFFNKRLKTKPYLIMSHRGFWGGNIIENSIASSILAYQAGADIVEVDVCKTADGDYYLFHDGNEPSLLGHQTNFKQLTTQEVEQTAILNAIGTNSGLKLTTLSDFLKWLPEDKLVNIDRSWDYWEDDNFFSQVYASGKIAQLVFKSPVQAKVIQAFIKNGRDLNYIPITHSREEANYIFSQQKLNTIGLELIIKNLDSELLDPDWIKEIKESGLFTVINAEHLGKGFNLLGGLTDHTAILNNNDWSPIVNLGCEVIQTDWPNFLNQYRENSEGGGHGVPANFNT